jgi:hypothetical protein
LAFPHPDEDASSRHHSSTEPPEAAHLLAKDEHAEEGSDEEIRCRVSDGNLGGRGGGGQSAREKGPHDNVAEDVEAEEDLLFSGVICQNLAHIE